ncbi:hypothetical protein DSECCO2_645740 [anaerobic digester metagenome]
MGQQGAQVARGGGVVAQSEDEVAAQPVGQGVPRVACGQGLVQGADMAFGIGGAEVAGAQGPQFVEVHDGVAAAQGEGVEGPGHVVQGVEKLFRRQGSGQGGEVVDHGHGFEAGANAVGDAQGAAALGELAPFGVHEEPVVGEMRRRMAQSLVEEDLAGGVGQVVLAAQDQGHAHVDVVDDHGQVVAGPAVLAQKHEIAEGSGRDAHVAFDEVGEGDVGLIREAEAHDVGLALGDTVGAFRGGEGCAASAVARGQALGRGFGAFAFEVRFGAEAGVGATVVGQPVHCRMVAVQAQALVPHGPVGGQAQPGQGPEDGRLVGEGGALAVRVLQAQEKAPAALAGQEEVEHGGARVAEVRHARGAGREAGDPGAAGLEIRHAGVLAAVTTATALMPSLRPVKPRCSSVVALTLT